MMKKIENETHDEERAFYGSHDLLIQNCRIDGPQDGESALKECRNIEVQDSYFNLRYPFWHDRKLLIQNSVLTNTCRAALWYSRDVKIKESKLYGIKALRESRDIEVNNSDISSPEFGWFCKGVKISDCDIQGDYLLLKSSDLDISRINLDGKYSFQYAKNAHLSQVNLLTKDSLWHAKNCTIEDSVIKGEYLSWYSENVTFIRCVIEGTQPLCYCKNLKLIDCRMDGCDLAFERSEVQATLTGSIDSIKNPLEGSSITVPKVGEIIRDYKKGTGKIIVSC